MIRTAHLSRARFLGLALVGFLALAPGCATTGDRGRALLPTRFETRVGPFAVHTETPLSPDAPLVRQLLSLEHQVDDSLGLRPSGTVRPIEIYVLADRADYAHFLRIYHPELPDRRAFFLAQGDRRIIYTHQNDRLIEDVRHEGTHALIHLRTSTLPLWLDEGLAEFFERPDSPTGFHPEHLDRLPTDLDNGWRPDLVRLESLTDVRVMSPRDYREAWAWVHWLVDGPPENRAVLHQYLSDLLIGRSTPSLSQRLATSGDSAPSPKTLLSHLNHVAHDRTARASIPAAAPEAGPVLRFQDTEAAKPSALLMPVKFFGKMLNRLGIGRSQ